MWMNHQDCARKNRKYVIKSWVTTYYIHISAPICQQWTGRRTCIPTWCRQLRTWINDREAALNHSLRHYRILHPDLLGASNINNVSTRPVSTGGMRIPPMNSTVSLLVTLGEWCNDWTVFCNNRSAPWSPAVHSKLSERSLKDKTIRDLSYRGLTTNTATQYQTFKPSIHIRARHQMRL